MALVNFVLARFLHFWNQTEIVCIFWQLYVESAMSACGAHHPWDCSRSDFRWHLMLWLSWRGGAWSRTGLDLQAFSNHNDSRILCYLGYISATKWKGSVPYRLLWILVTSQGPSLAHTPSESCQDWAWAYFISFSAQVIQWPTCVIKVICFMFQFCKVLPDLVGKYFKGAKHYLLEGWEESTWHREAE